MAHLSGRVVGGAAEGEQDHGGIALGGGAIERALRRVQPLAVGAHEGRPRAAVDKHLDGVDACVAQSPNQPCWAHRMFRSTAKTLWQV
jgi:hypothetical protein